MAAREAAEKQGHKVEYHDVRYDEVKMKEMLAYSDGTRKVPVIVEKGRVTIGFEGKT